MPSAEQRTWKDQLRRHACWATPGLLLLVVACFIRSGSGLGATTTWLFSLLAVLACPLGMLFMVRGMIGLGRRRTPTPVGPKSNAPVNADRPE